jgi:hypothetical protein
METYKMQMVVVSYIGPSVIYGRYTKVIEAGHAVFKARCREYGGL